jgi:hypothetical protein
MEDCHSLGIRLVRSKQFVANSTHFITKSVVYTVPLLTTLVSSAYIVTIAFVDEVIRRSKLPKQDADSFQKVFVPPDERDYFPEEVTTEIMSREESKRGFAANKQRQTLFVGTTLLLLHEGEAGNRQLESVAALCKGAGARVVNGDVSTLTDDETMLRFFRRNKSEAETFLAENGAAASQAPDEGLVVVCSGEDTTAGWYSNVVLMTRR